MYTGRSYGAVPFLEELGYPLSKNYNPGDYFMNVLSSEEFQEKEYRDAVVSKLTRITPSVNNTSDEPVPHYQVGMYMAFRLLLSRALLESARNPLILKGKFLKIAIVATLSSMLFAGLGTTLADLGDRYSSVYMLTNSVIMEGMMSTVTTFHMQKVVFMREYSSRKYTIEAFFLSYIIAILPIEMLYVFGYYGITYYILKLNPLFGSFLQMLAVGALTSMSGSGFGLLISSAAPTMEVAGMLAPLTFIPMLLSGGLLVSYNRGPEWFFIKYLSPFRYGFEASAMVDFDDNPDLSHEVRTQGIDNLGLPESLQFAIVGLAGLVIGTRILALFAMKYINRKN